MLTISKPLSASQARTYHEREFTSQQQNYWSRDQQGHSEWQGKLAEEWKLTGAVEAEHFARLSEGQHPHTTEQLVQHQVSRTYEGKFGKEVTSVEHRAGWDATFSAPKSVSLTALVGGDERVRGAHRDSVRVALAELERYTQARIGNVHAPETTGKLIAATFEHDTARPVDGYAAPQLHTHAVIFNVTERENGQTRSLQPHEMFVSQRYATAVYRSELALRLEKLGYEVERGKHGQPEIRGYTKEYLEASSPRREQIKEHLREQGIDGAAAAQIAAHHTRDRKELVSPEEVLQRHRELAARFGHQADRIVSQALQHGQCRMREPEKEAQRAVTWARDHVFERSAVQDRRAILEMALTRGMGETTYARIRHEFERRIEAGEFREVSHTGAGHQYTTAAMARMEREIVGRMQEGNRRDFGDHMLVSPQVRIATEDRHPDLNASRRQAVDDIFLSRERIVGLDGNGATPPSYYVMVINGNDINYTLASNPTSTSVTAGQSATFTLTVTPQSSWTSPITFSCTFQGVGCSSNGTSPSWLGFTFSPTSVPPNASTATTTLTVTTAAPTASIAPIPLGRRSGPLYAIWLMLPAMLFGTMGLVRPQRRKLLSYVLVCLLAGGCLLQAACAGGSSGNGGGGGGAGGTGGTPAGTYTITISGIAGSTTQTTTVTLTVQ